MNDIGNNMDVSKYRIGRANDDVRSAKILFDENLLEAANNRAYYACYHAISSVLALEPIAFKRHKDTLAYFNKHYVHAGIFPKDIGRKLHNIKEVREESDYEDFYIVDKNETKEFVEFAEEFVALIANYLKENRNA